MFRFATVLMLAMSCVGDVPALEPSQIIVIANRNMPESLAVADHYCAKRNVPKGNVVVLDLPVGENVSRADYDAKIVRPLREALRERKDRIKVILCVYGVPLRVGERQPSERERGELAREQTELTTVKAKIKQLEGSVTNKADIDRIQPELTAARAERKRLEERRQLLAPTQSQAAVDNELMLLWWDNYSLERFVVNPLHVQAPAGYRDSKPLTLMTARLDGPTPEIAKRLVDDAVEVEKVGLKGKVYVDSWEQRYDPNKDPGYGYGGYDESMREMAQLLRGSGKMDVTLDERSVVFQAGACPDCALYCGWYSHANYVDSCRFVKGAVAWHLASSEAVSLRTKDSKLWCPNLLRNGVCATLGPVAEPYTVGFPKPAEFFGWLATGEFTLVECYARSLNLTSWMCTLIGDPLYNPFKAAPRLKVEMVNPSPKAGKFLLR